MPRREFLMQAKPYDADKHSIGGYYMSEKVDGSRSFWDGGVSRGVATDRVPWASIINPETGKRKAKILPEATGLWTRYGNPIIAPDWFLNSLPACPLDGELWAGRGNYQLCRSIVSCDSPKRGGEDWRKVSFAAFGCPDFNAVMQDGEIKNKYQHTHIRKAQVQEWLRRHSKIADWENLTNPAGLKFSNELAYLSEWIDTTSDTVFLLAQTKLPKDQREAEYIVQQKLREILANGGEGVVLRNPDSVWTPLRTENVVKLKAALDDEATIVGFTSGEKTTKGSKLLGMIGALILDYNGSRLKLSGMNNEERQFVDDRMSMYASNFPGEEMPDHFQGRHFRVGDRVTFTYRELTDDGLPKEARLLRKRDTAE